MLDRRKTITLACITIYRVADGGGSSICPLTRRNPIRINIIPLKLDPRSIASRRLDDQPALRERVERAPEVPVGVDAQALGEPRQLREVVRGRRHAGHVLLALDPDVHGLHVRARQEAVLRRPRLRHAVDLRHHAVVPRVARQDVRAVLELVLWVAAAAQPDGRYDAVGYGAGARVDVHCVEGYC